MVGWQGGYKTVRATSSDICCRTRDTLRMWDTEKGQCGETTRGCSAQLMPGRKGWEGPKAPLHVKRVMRSQRLESSITNTESLTSPHHSLGFPFSHPRSRSWRWGQCLDSQLMRRVSEKCNSTKEQKVHVNHTISFDSNPTNSLPMH